MKPVPGLHAAHSRRGGVYIAVAGTVVFVTLIGVAGLGWWIRTDNSASLIDEQRTARALARSGIELGVERIASDADWRVSYGKGAWDDAMEMDGGSISLVLRDDGDGRLEDDAADHAMIAARVKVGRARRELQAELEPLPVAINALATAIWSGEGVVIEDCFGFNAALPVYATEELSVKGQYADADLQSSTSVSTSAGARSVTVVAKDRYTAPDWDALERAIGKIGTAIKHSDVRDGLRNVVLSPESNPFGDPDPNGIYFVKVNGRGLTLENVRIVGTLIVLGGDVTIEGTQHWEQGETGMPVLIAEGDIAFAMNGVPLSELAIGVNLNPEGTPYEGETDSDLLDSYPPRITGMVVGLGDISVTGGMNLYGSLFAAGQVDLSTAIVSIYDEPKTRSSPPDGLREWGSAMRVVDGSWSWVSE